MDQLTQDRGRLVLWFPTEWLQPPPFFCYFHSRKASYSFFQAPLQSEGAGTGCSASGRKVCWEIKERHFLLLIRPLQFQPCPSLLFALNACLRQEARSEGHHHQPSELAPAVIYFEMAHFVGKSKLSVYTTSTEIYHYLQLKAPLPIYHS